MTDPTRIMECHKGSERCSGPMDISHKAVWFFSYKIHVWGREENWRTEKLVVFRVTFFLNLHPCRFNMVHLKKMAHLEIRDPFRKVSFSGSTFNFGGGGDE